MSEDALATLAHRYTHLVKADIRGFYPSIYTHSIAWALHTRRKFRRDKRSRWDYSLLGNRLDRLFQYGNSGRTNGIPIGPVVSDIVAEVIAAAVDRHLTRSVIRRGFDCAMARFKDDYRILVKSEADGREILKALQAALREFDLELAERKTEVCTLPEGLFRNWVSEYHAAYPRKRSRFTWKAFRELYLAVLRIDREHPGTGVVDRFLADIISKDGQLKISFWSFASMQKAIRKCKEIGDRYGQCLFERMV